MEKILEIRKDTSLVNLNWLRPCTPNTNDGKEKVIDSVEFEINHKGIEKLERNINNETEYVMCFVHFNAGTEKLDGIYLSVWDNEHTTDDSIDSNVFDEEEIRFLLDYALVELRKGR